MLLSYLATASWLYVRNRQRTLRESRDPPLRSELAQPFRDGGADVVTRGQVSAANDFVRERTVNQHASPALDERLDLGLPLLRANKAGRSEHGQDLFGVPGSDGHVDGIDASLIAASLGSTAGSTGYTPAADADRSGTIDASDVQIAGSNFGFAANGPPTLAAGSAPVR